ncbi:shikimate dehydrogenase [Rhizobacter sp. OV335]|uniref:shikimate dehydrogenase family protein n=1 Tax=Rhizobacter sp. OV335 TaxID=1500264 RepID=UPI000917523C|nr:shikimate dehydrogenase [Rhizobacter sp. OV335]SHM35837.1 shikimate dehydrogenase [Rhizobacter sp. OV335]
MTLSGSTRVFLILGDPVAQVRAPEVFNHLFARHGADAVLVPAQVAAADLAGFARQALKARNIDGLWLAIPHKTAMVELLDRCDRLGRSAGAVNAARRNADDTLEGALFDGVGFTKALAHFDVPVQGRSALVVGVGGGGVAIATSLAAAGAARIALFDTTPGRTAAIAARLAAEFGVDVVPLDRPDPAGFDLVVNATPLGLRPDDPLPFDPAQLDPGTVVVDILMKNQPTPLLRACHARGIVAHPGFEMLVQQVPEYLSFFGFDRIAQAVQEDASDVRALFQPQGDKT